MRVLHVIPSIAPRYGGPSLAVIAMCRALAQQGVDVLIATTDADGNGHLNLEHGSPTTYRDTSAIIFRREWSEAFKYSRPLAHWLDQHVADFDMVHVHAVFSHSCVAAGQACRRSGVPYVVRPLGTLDPWSMRQKQLRKRIMWHCGAKQLLHGAAAVHYTAAEERRLAEASLGLTRGVVIPLGVDEALLERPPAPEAFRDAHPQLGNDPYVLTLSRLHPKKGLETFLEAYLEVSRETVGLRWLLVVAGDGEQAYTSRLQRLVRERHGDERVLFTGWLSGAQKHSALSGAALLALTSEQENFGLAVVEALAQGVPALVSSAVNLADEIQAAGAGWVTELDRHAQARALREVMRDDDERARRGAAGRRLVVTRYIWGPIAEQLQELYRSVLIAPQDPGAA